MPIRKEDLNKKIDALERELSAMRDASPLDEKGYARTVSSKAKLEYIAAIIRQRLTDVSSSWVSFFGALCVIGPSMGEFKLFSKNLDENGHRKFGPDFGPDGQPEPPGLGIIDNGLKSMSYQNIIWAVIVAARGVGLTLSIYDMSKMLKEIKNLKQKYITERESAFKEALNKYLIAYHKELKEKRLDQSEIEDKINHKKKEIEDNFAKAIELIDSIDGIKEAIEKNKAVLQDLRIESEKHKLAGNVAEYDATLEKMHALAEENLRLSIILAGSDEKNKSYIGEVLKSQTIYKAVDLLRTGFDFAGRIVMLQPLLQFGTWGGYAQGAFVWFFGEAIFGAFRLVRGIVQYLRDKADRKVDNSIFKRLFGNMKDFDGTRFTDVVKMENGVYQISPGLKADIEKYAGSSMACNSSFIETIGLLYKEALFPMDGGFSAVRDDSKPREVLSQEQITAFEAVGRRILTDRERGLIKEVLHKIFEGNPDKEKLKADIERLMAYVVSSSEEERLSASISPKSIEDLYNILYQLRAVVAVKSDLNAEQEKALRIRFFKHRFNMAREDVMKAHPKSKFIRVYRFFKGQSVNYEKYINLKTLKIMRNDPEFEFYVRYVKALEKKPDVDNNNSYMDLYHEHQGQLRGIYRRVNINQSRKFRKLGAGKLAGDTVEMLCEAAPEGETRFEVLEQKPGKSEAELERQKNKLEAVKAKEAKLQQALLNLRAIGSVTGKKSNRFGLVARIWSIKKGHSEGFDRRRCTDEGLSVERRKALLDVEKKKLQREFTRSID